MMSASIAANLLKRARERSGLSQRQLAKKARTAQSVVARVELGQRKPSLPTLMRLLKAAGFNISIELQRVPVVNRSMLDDVPRILSMTPEDRLREVAQVSRFISAARRA